MEEQHGAATAPKIIYSTQPQCCSGRTRKGIIKPWKKNEKKIYEKKMKMEFCIVFISRFSSFIF